MNVRIEWREGSVRGREEGNEGDGGGGGRGGRKLGEGGGVEEELNP